MEAEPHGSAIARALEDYTAAKEEMLKRTNTPEARWYIVEGNDKRRARLNCMAHLLEQIPYEEVPQETVALPERKFNPNYERHPIEKRDVRAACVRLSERRLFLDWVASRQLACASARGDLRPS